MSMSDRHRDQVKAQADWSPTDPLSLQFTYQWGKDSYSSPVGKGLSGTRTQLIGVDASYAFSEMWKSTAYYSYTEQQMDVAHSTGYIANLKDRNNAAGLNITGKPSERWAFGGDIFYVDDVNSYAQSLDPNASTNNVTFFDQFGGLPNVTFSDFRVSLFASYAIQKNSEIRFDLVHDQQKLNEWTWSNDGTPFVYSDGSTVSINPNQSVTYFAIRYIYRWR
jgi:hypothetical protein